MDFLRIFLKSCLIRFPQIIVMIWAFTAAASLSQKIIINLNYVFLTFIWGLASTGLLAIYDCFSYHPIKKLEKEIENNNTNYEKLYTMESCMKDNKRLNMKKIIDVFSFSFIDKMDEKQRESLTLKCNLILALVAMIGIIFICLQIWMQGAALEQQNRAIQQTQTQIEDNQQLLNNTFGDMNKADYRNAANLVIGSSLFGKNYTSYTLLNSQYSSYPAILYLGEWSTIINGNEEMVHYYVNETLLKTEIIEKELIFLWVVSNSSEIKPRDGINIYINNSYLKNGNNALRINMPYGDLSRPSDDNQFQYKRVWGLFSLDYNSSTKEIVKALLISFSRFPDLCVASSTYDIKDCVPRNISAEGKVEIAKVD